MWRIVAAAAGLVVAALLSGWGTPLQEPAGTGDPVAAAAVAELVAGRGGDIAVLGYRPVERGGIVVRPAGDCSSPLGGTAYGFTDICARHDLGYDLLRHAARTGAALGGWARRAIDDQFAAGLAQRCARVDGGLGCSAAAVGYAAVVRLNTWRQGDGPPLAEAVGKLPTAAVGGLGAAILVAGRAARRGAARRSPPVRADEVLPDSPR